MRLMEFAEAALAAVTIGVILPFSPLLRSWYNRLGATPAEASKSYAHDSRVPHPRQEYTRAITINAPPYLVWAYLIQLGQERGGMYSYDLLENLAGCEMHSVEHIVPDWQTIQVGGLIRFGPKSKGYPVQKVVDLEPGKALVLAGADPKTEQVFMPTDPMPSSYANAVWAFYMEPIGTRSTRLVIRSRLDYAGSASIVLLWRVTEVLNFVMEQKMMHTFKRVAERDARLGQARTT